MVSRFPTLYLSFCTLCWREGYEWIFSRTCCIFANGRQELPRCKRTLRLHNFCALDVQEGVVKCCVSHSNNRNTNKCLSTRGGVSLIGFARHRFNLTVTTVLFEEHYIIKMIDGIKMKLKNLILSAELFKLSVLRRNIIMSLVGLQIRKEATVWNGWALL